MLTPNPLLTSSELTSADVPTLIAAVGALGVASMGIVETLGKSLLVYDTPGARRRQWMSGLPYAGYGSVKRLINRVGPALRVAYGDQYAEVIAEQYRNGRADGQAPDTIRQGVRLGLPYLPAHQAEHVISAVWGLRDDISKAFALSLTLEKTATPPIADDAGVQPPAVSDIKSAQALAARFATALDTSVQAAFSSSEAAYQSWVRFWAGAAALVLSVAYFAVQPEAATNWTHLSYWFKPVLVGFVAVPLAPISKDLASGVSQALAALGTLRGKSASAS